ncbi:hypothetical protein GCM10010246_58980 [Streptomyces cuspidosporus]|uniref:Secreted protein n=1 Tax=Streptomyces cuspidosporus TaxID=66882 RepID=A0ABN3GUL9_9ACTN
MSECSLWALLGPLTGAVDAPSEHPVAGTALSVPFPRICEEQNAAFIRSAPEPRGPWTTLTGCRRMRDSTAGPVAGDRADMVGVNVSGTPAEFGVGAVPGRQRGGHGQWHRGHPVDLQRPEQPQVEQPDSSAQRVGPVR